MRVLCTCVPGHGHFHPMVPIARALKARGHEVAFATAERFCPRVAQAGFQAFPAGLAPGPMVERTLALPGVAAPGPEDAGRFGAQMFAAVAGPAKVPDLVAVVADWKPHLLVHDVTDFAGPVAAARAGIPCAAHSLGPMFPIDLYRLGAKLMAPVWRETAATPGPYGGMFGTVYLDICPPSLQSPDLRATGAVVRPLQPVPFDAVGGESLPAWVDRPADRPTVYVTLGTVDNDAPGVTEAAVEGLRDEPLTVIASVGPNRDPAELGPQPDNVHVERYVPQSLMLPHCDAVVTHGGSGTMLAALAHGLPLLLLPQGANQFWNADRCAALGVGVRLVPGEVDAGSVRRAVRALLQQTGFRARAGDIAAEIERMPPPSAVAGTLEALVAGAGS
ncbi:MAG: glycosyltransferase [Acidimicrobiales bacterium]